MGNQYDSMSGDPFGGYDYPVKKKSKGPIIAIIAAAVTVAIVAAVLVAVFVFGIFDSKETKMLKAIAKTYEDKGELGKALDATSIVESGEYTVNIKADVSAMGMSASGDIDFIICKEGKEIYADVSAPIGYYGSNMDIEGGLQLDDEALRFYCSLLGDVYALYYDEDPTGFLGEEDNIEEFEALAKELKTIASTDTKASSEKTKEVLTDLFKSLEFESASKKTIEVNGKDRKCSGYTAEINMADLLETIIEKYEDQLPDEMVSEVMNEIDDYDEEFELSLYLYDGMIAAIIIEADGDEVTLEFNGGDFRTQNMTLKAGKKKLAEVKGSTKGNVEKCSIKVDGEEVGGYKYDTKKKELTFYATAYGEEASIVFELESKKNEISLSLVDVVYGGSSVLAMADKCELVITVSKGGDLSSFSGREVDLGSLTKEELEEIGYLIENAFDF